MTRVAVAGVLGRMGRVAYSALQNLPDITYVGGFARRAVPDERIFDDFEKVLECEPDVLLDLTTYPKSAEISMRAIVHGVRPVIGATGWSFEERDALATLAAERGLGAMMVPNFSIGAVLMMRFAEQAARFFPTAAIVELHHDKKLDKPSGTAKLTADKMVAAGFPNEVPISSIRLRGLLAHQEVLFGGEGETLTIRHDTSSRDCYVPGMLAAIRAVMQIEGLVVGLDSVLAETSPGLG